MAGRSYCKSVGYSECHFQNYYTKTVNTKLLRIVISGLALMLVGKIPLSKTETISSTGSEWFITMAMFIGSYFPDTMIKEENRRLSYVRLIQLAISIVLITVSILGLFNVLCLGDSNGTVVLQTDSNFVLSGVKLGNLFFWWILCLVFEMCLVVRYVAMPTAERVRNQYLNDMRR